MTIQERLDEAIDRLDRCRRVRAEMDSIGGCEDAISEMNYRIHQLVAHRRKLQAMVFELDSEIERAII